VARTARQSANEEAPMHLPANSPRRGGEDSITQPTEWTPVQYWTAESLVVFVSRCSNAFVQEKPMAVVDRRAFLVATIVASGCGPGGKPIDGPQREATTGAAPSIGKSQSAISRQTPPRVAVLVFGSRRSSLVTSGPKSADLLIRDRLEELGYVEGKTIVLEESYADGDPRRLAQLAIDIVASKPDAIVTIAAAATAAARQATNTIPIIMAHVGEPVGAGLVASLARPGGNVTGTTSMIPDLGAKQVELLRQLVPRISRLGVLANPANTGTQPLLAQLKESGRQFKISVVVAEVQRTEDFDKAFGVLRAARPDALFIMVEPLIGLNIKKVLDFAATARLPASFDVGREAVRQGGLISYGPVLATHYAMVADYVDKVLKGAKPGDLPIQQPTQFALAINLKTAKALGIKVPQSLLLRADELIE